MLLSLLLVLSRLQLLLLVPVADAGVAVRLAAEPLPPPPAAAEEVGGGVEACASRLRRRIWPGGGVLKLLVPLLMSAAPPAAAENAPAAKGPMLPTPLWPAGEPSPSLLLRRSDTAAAAAADLLRAF